MTHIAWLAALLAGGIGLVVAGAEAFFAGLLAMARRWRTSAVFLTAVISGLELENIVAGIAANQAGFPGAAAGTFLGGTTFVALGVAGLGAILVPAPATLPAPFVALTALSGLPLFIVAADGQLSRGDGVILIAWFALAMITLFRTAGDLATADQDDDEASERRWPLLWLTGGLVGMGVGGELLGNALRAAFLGFGVSPTLLGNTAIAALTEAEELGRVAIPARRGRADVAAANIGGTAIHFLSLNAGILALVHPLLLDETTLWLHLPVAVAAPAIYALALGVRRGLGRGDGVFLVTLYGLYLAAAIMTATGRVWW
jgi:cation:H+ antiporter